MNSEIIEKFREIGIDVRRVINFLKHECKIEIGFEAQLVGTGAMSATTTGLMTYVLSHVGELSDDDINALMLEIDKFKIKDGEFGDIYGTTHACSWASAQILLALIEIDAKKDTIEKSLNTLISKYQLPSGGWCFSCSDDEKLVYCIYPILVLLKAGRKYSLNYDRSIESTKNYLLSYIPHTETEKIIVLGLLNLINKYSDCNSATSMPSFIINYAKLLTEEFGSAGVNEFTVYPFSMRVYTPSLYLLSRHFLRPDEPFSIYLMRYLVTNIHNHKSWTPIATTIHSPIKPCSFCTALALLSLYKWISDSLKVGVDIRRLLSENNEPDQLITRIEQLHRPTHLFIAYSSHDEQIVTPLVSRFRELGFQTTYAKFDLLVGDSIIDYINDGLAKMDFFIIFLTPDSLRSPFVRTEFGGAVAKELSSRHVSVLPALLRECSLPPLLLAKKCANFINSSEQGFNDLLISIRKHAKRKRDTFN